MCFHFQLKIKLYYLIKTCVVYNLMYGYFLFNCFVFWLFFTAFYICNVKTFKNKSINIYISKTIHEYCLSGDAVRANRTNSNWQVEKNTRIKQTSVKVRFEGRVNVLMHLNSLWWVTTLYVIECYNGNQK